MDWNMISLLASGAYRQVANKSGKGPEWAGPCPVCGGNEKRGSDRFHIWPEQQSGKTAGTFWCRQCQHGGDLIEFHMWTKGVDFKEAARLAGATLSKTAQNRRGATQQKTRTIPFIATESQNPDLLWSEHCRKFIDWCHSRLLDNNHASERDWLAARGIGRDAIVKFCLGWNPTHAWRERTAWGLAPLVKDDGKPRKLFLPRGLVIPIIAGGTVRFCCVRQPDQEPKYYVIPGCNRLPVVTRTARVMVVVESYLDAMLLDSVAGDLAGFVALGAAQKKPDIDLHGILNQASHISVSLDSDEVKTLANGMIQAPGQQASRWWLENYEQARRVPVIGGKDPGDAYQHGVDLRSWVLAGMPEALAMMATAGLSAQSREIPQDIPANTTGNLCNTPEKQQEIPPETGMNAPENPPQMEIYGRKVTLTDDKKEWLQRSLAGEICFSTNELSRIKPVFAGMDGDEREKSTNILLDIKEIFSCAYVRAARQEDAFE